ncbi:hypothetical protein LVY74_02205 [Acinetobacter sp. ME22]|uniref:hypothetical protein n=1 Tax=Acinetobacter sp. ME22 TaxID=2904802 RepID=UPI001EDB2D17|nr:hypothetical protein [Acinetobacter sp. ME22]MCG2572370.1 hypothetical protein [Acinetobacter sp. ME22]
MSTLKDLNKHLFDQLDRLSNASKEDLETELQRSESIQGVSEQIIKAHTVQLNAVKLVAEYRGLNPSQKAPLIEVGDASIEV